MRHFVNPPTRERNMVQVVWARLRATSLVAVLLLAASGVPAGAQTMEDGLMMPKENLCTGFLYAHDSWENYWEGSLKRINGNIGTVTTEAISWMGNYGVTDRLNVIAMVPYVKTRASQGVLQGMQGFQDLTVAAKYHLLETDFTKHGTLRTIVVASAGAPLSDYTPDFMPLSIGLASKSLSGRLTLMFHAKRRWFIHASGAYTWRGNVTLDRSAYFTEDRLFLSDEVAMPDVFSYVVSAGYLTPRLHVPISFSQQITQGGGDIRRQDMPFVSNRMDFQKVEALAMYYLPKPRNLSVRLAGTYAVNGRNVGQATTVTAGLFYLFKF
jgi:hypothetical protein